MGPEWTAALCAERHADAELVGPLADRERQPRTGYDPRVMLKTRPRLVLTALAFMCASAAPTTQSPGYPVELVAPGKGPFTFPPGYQTPWDKIEIVVTSKMSANLFVLHGSEG